MLALLFVAMLSTTAPAARKHAPPKVAPSPPAAATAALYSRRFRKRVSTYLRLRLLELRSNDLAGIADRIERRLRCEGVLTKP